MAKYKDVNYEQDKLIPIAFSKQIVPGSFEYTLAYIVDHHIDLSVFDQRYCNDDVGRKAYDPAVLLKIVLYAYSKGIVSSRKIAQCCRENVLFMALSADSQPHFTTIADFIASMDQQIVDVFRDVLLYCDKLGLIGKEMFAIDGCKLPSNASKSWSGTKFELKQKKKKMEKLVQFMLGEHRRRDRRDATSPAQQEKEQQRIAALEEKIKKIKDWLDNNDDKPSSRGKPRKSNVTDNDSAKMKTNRGVIQGFTAIGAVDAAHQIVVHAEAHGEAQEHGLLAPTVESIREHFATIGQDRNVFKKAKLSADAGFHSRKNIAYIFEQRIDGYIADPHLRKRDPRFADVERYKTRSRNEKRAAEGKGKAKKRFGADEFHIDADSGRLICPAGKTLYRRGRRQLSGCWYDLFEAPLLACRSCELREQCLRHPEHTPVRQVAKIVASSQALANTLIDKMKRKLDTLAGRVCYSQRLGIVEPVFGNLQNKGLRRFTLRGKRKVDTQWKLYCLVHNVEKIHGYGLAFR